jgi:hypothetical protein
MQWRKFGDRQSNSNPTAIQQQSNSNPTMTPNKLSIIVLSIALLAACGGGSEEAPPSDTPSPAGTATGAASDPAGPAAGAGGGEDAPPSDTPRPAGTAPGAASDPAGTAAGAGGGGSDAGDVTPEGTTTATVVTPVGGGSLLATTCNPTPPNDSPDFELVFKSCNGAVTEFYEKTECVRDKRNNRYWQGSVNDDSALRYWANGYTNYRLSAAHNEAVVFSSSNAEGFARAVNDTRLCGRTNWRIPNKDELRSLQRGWFVGGGAAATDNFWFPYTGPVPFWTKNTPIFTLGTTNTHEWATLFWSTSAGADQFLRDRRLRVRLVSN